MDMDGAERFLQTRNNVLAPAGMMLKDEAKEQIAYYKSAAALHAKLAPDSTLFHMPSSDRVPGPDAFLKEAGALYKNNPEFRDLLIIALFKAAVSKKSAALKIDRMWNGILAGQKHNNQPYFCL